MVGKKRTHLFCFVSLLTVFVLSATVEVSAAQDGDELEATRSELRQLKEVVAELAKEIQKLKAQRSEDITVYADQQKQLQRIREDVAVVSNLTDADRSSPESKFSFGGYGEVHANFNESEDADLIDFHRLVLYLGYDFADWIKFHSEWELEHAFVGDSADGSNGGEFLIEQAFVDFLLSESLNVRAGRVLTPLGIINKKHEPPLFNGVERPSFAKFIIPSTWSSDGVGIFGSINSALNYEAYVVGGLDGSGFSALNGIRDGRIKERPSLNEVAFTGRLDYYPSVDQDLRLGFSMFSGGLNNSNNGGRSGIDGDISIYSSDFEYSVSKFDFSGAIAHTSISSAREIGSAEEIFGWYLEGGYHFLPENMKKGKLKESDAVAFVRFDSFDTQYKMPSGVSANPAGDRQEWTFGVNFYLTPDFVVKADYQIRDDATTGSLNDLFNVGMGWQF